MVAQGLVLDVQPGIDVDAELTLRAIFALAPRGPPCAAVRSWFQIQSEEACARRDARDDSR